MEARAATLLDFGRADEARLDARACRGAAARRSRPATRRRWCSPHWPSHRAIGGDFDGARSAAEQAVTAASGVGSAGREASARMMLGLSLVYLEQGDSGLLELEAASATRRGGRRPCVGAPRPREPVGRAAEPRPVARIAAEVAVRGVELAARVGLTRSVYGVAGDAQPRRGAVPHRPAGTRRTGCSPARSTTSWRTRTRASSSITAPGSPHSPGAMTTSRADLDAAQRLLPARHGGQYSFAHAFAAAEMERALGDTTGAREDVRRALEHEAVAPIPRFTPGSSCGWACGWRPRPPSPRPTGWPRLRRCRASCPRRPRRRSPTARSRPASRPAPPGARRTGRRRSRRPGGPGTPTSSRTRCCAGPRSRARRRIARARRPAAQEAARLAAALGAAPLLGEVRALARRARLRIEAAAPAAEPDATGIDAFGLTQREREVLQPARRRALEPADRRSAVHQPQDRERPCVEHPRQARRRKPRRSSRRGPSPRARAAGS